VGLSGDFVSNQTFSFRFFAKKRPFFAHLAREIRSDAVQKGLFPAIFLFLRENRPHSGLPFLFFGVTTTSKPSFPASTPHLPHISRISRSFRASFATYFVYFSASRVVAPKRGHFRETSRRAKRGHNFFSSGQKAGRPITGRPLSPNHSAPRYPTAGLPRNHKGPSTTHHAGTSNGQSTGLSLRCSAPTRHSEQIATQGAKPKPKRAQYCQYSAIQECDVG